MAQQVVNEVNREFYLREDNEKCQWFIISTIRSVQMRVQIHFELYYVTHFCMTLTACPEIGYLEYQLTNVVLFISCNGIIIYLFH